MCLSNSKLTLKRMCFIQGSGTSALATIPRIDRCQVHISCECPSLKSLILSGCELPGFRGEPAIAWKVGTELIFAAQILLMTPIYRVRFQEQRQLACLGGRDVIDFRNNIFNDRFHENGM